MLEGGCLMLRKLLLLFGLCFLFFIPIVSADSITGTGGGGVSPCKDWCVREYGKFRHCAGEFDCARNMTVYNNLFKLSEGECSTRFTAPSDISLCMDYWFDTYSEEISNNLSWSYRFLIVSGVIIFFTFCIQLIDLFKSWRSK